MFTYTSHLNIFVVECKAVCDRMDTFCIFNYMGTGTFFNITRSIFGCQSQHFIFYHRYSTHIEVRNTTLLVGWRPCSYSTTALIHFRQLSLLIVVFLFSSVTIYKFMLMFAGYVFICTISHMLVIINLHNTMYCILSCILYFRPIIFYRILYPPLLTLLPLMYVISCVCQVFNKECMMMMTTQVQ